MKNILFLTNIYPNNDPHYGGTAVCHSFATEWVRMGYNVRVVHFDSLFPRPYYWVGKLFNSRIQAKTGTVAYTGTSRRPRSYQVDNVRVLFVPLRKLVPHRSPGGLVVARAVATVREWLEGEAFVPEVITAHFVLPQLEMLYHLKGLWPGARTCLVLHGGSSVLEQNYHRRTAELMRRVDVWGFRSEAFRRSFEKRYGTPQHQFICYSGIPEKYIEPVSRTFADGVRRFVFVGSLYELKNVDITLQALHKAMGGRDYRFDIVGSGAEEGRLRRMVAELGMGSHVVFHGQQGRDEAQEIMRQADCFVMVSSREAFGLVYLEAMAKGLVVVGTCGQGIDGIVRHGMNGFLCAARDVEGLAGLIGEIVALPPAELSRISAAAVSSAAGMTDGNVAAHYIDAICHFNNSSVHN